MMKQSSSFSAIIAPILSRECRLFATICSNRLVKFLEHYSKLVDEISAAFCGSGLSVVWCCRKPRTHELLTYVEPVIGSWEHPCDSCRAGTEGN
jgi:hypothetical protein